MSTCLHDCAVVCRNRVSDRVYLGRGTLRGTLMIFPLFIRLSVYYRL